MKLFCFLFVAFLSFSSFGAKVLKISIKGHKVLQVQNIKSHLRLKIGQSFRSKVVREDVKNLHSLGFFEKIEVHSYPFKKGLHIIYKIKEKPLVTAIEFKGNKNVRTDDLKDLITIKLFDFLNRDDLHKSFQAIKEKYEGNGYFMVDISHQLSNISEKQKTKQQKKIKAPQLKLVVTIKENTKLLVKRINFIGNRNISSSVLKSFLATKQQNILSFIGKSGVYNVKDLTRDLKVIEYIYRDKGFLNVRLEKPEVSLSKDQKGVYISLTISEGVRFKLGEVALKPTEIISQEKAQKHLQLKQGNYFSLTALQKDLAFVRNLYKEKGYAFAEVAPQMFPDPSGENILHLLFVPNPGDRYKINEVIIQGNHETRDKVILRQLFLKEGDSYKESSRQITQQLLQQLGFFEQARVFAIKKEDKKGLLDIAIDLKERENTGEASLAGGWNSYSRLFIQGSIKENNFLGLGQTISFQVSLNRYQEIFSFSYLDPYFLDSDWRLGFDIFNFGQDILNGRQSNNGLGLDRQQDLSYSQLNTGFSVTFGKHLTQSLTTSLKYRLQQQNLGNTSFQFLRSIPIIKPVFIALFGEPFTEEEQASGSLSSFSDIYPLKEGEGLNSSLSAILEYDKRNDRFQTSKGYYGKFSVEFSGLGGDFNYTKAQANIRHYYPIKWGIILKNAFNAGLVFSNTKNKTVPFTELFLLGGPYNLRGFQTNTIGPRVRSKKAFEYATAQGLSNPESFADRPYGGKQMFYYNLELETPLLPQAQLRGAIFLDIGEVHNRLGFDLEDQLRLNVGVGVRWRSPFGLINIDLGMPYKPRKQYGENSVELQFGVGSGF